MVFLRMSTPRIDAPRFARSDRVTEQRIAQINRARPIQPRSTRFADQVSRVAHVPVVFAAICLITNDTSPVSRARIGA